MIGVIALLMMLYQCYWQAIAAYPDNSGTFRVAKSTLGYLATLLCAAALMLDYLLNVAVGISAGVAALSSAIPQLQPHTGPRSAAATRFRATRAQMGLFQWHLVLGDLLGRVADRLQRHHLCAHSLVCGGGFSRLHTGTGKHGGALAALFEKFCQ